MSGYRSGTISSGDFQLGDLLDKRAQRRYITGAAVLYLIGTVFHLMTTGRYLWAGYGLVTAGIILSPLMLQYDVTDLPPYELVVLCCIPFTLRALPEIPVATHTLSYLAAAALAVVVFAELEEHMGLRTSQRFTVVLLVLTTIAIAGGWAITRWLSDIMFGTGFLISDSVLMWEFVLASGTGLLAGALYNIYLERLVMRGAHR